MVIKFVESTFDSFREKFKNPFFGTLLIVWLIRNREFIYNLFFNSECTPDEKLEILHNRFNSWGTLWNLLLTMVISLLLMTLIYGALNLSRFIVNYSERILKPRILKLFSDSAIVSRELFESVERERDYYQKKYTEERIERIKIQRELDDSSNKVIDGGDAFSKSEKINTRTLISRQNLADNIVNKKMKEDFLSLAGLINSLIISNKINEIIPKDSMKEFLSKNLILRYWERESYYYKFTPIGEIVRDFMVEQY